MLTAPPSINSKKTERDTPASAALKCAYTLMQQRIISHPNDMMGVLLYGTEETKFQEDDQYGGGLSYPHCYLLNDLNIPSADDVKALRSLVEDEQVSKKVLIPNADSVSMANVLFCANQIFTTRAPNFQSRRLFIVTDDDDPHKSDRALKSSATVRAKDLYDLGVTIELFPISRPDHEFDRSKFYDVSPLLLTVVYNIGSLFSGHHLQCLSNRSGGPSAHSCRDRAILIEGRYLAPPIPLIICQLESRSKEGTLLGCPA